MKGSSLVAVLSSRASHLVPSDCHPVLWIIAVGGHDSSDAVIERVRDAFGVAHRYLRVGEEIVIRAP